MRPSQGSMGMGLPGGGCGRPHTLVTCVGEGVKGLRLAKMAGKADNVGDSLKMLGKTGDVADGAKALGKGGSEIIELSKSNIQHIKKHTFSGMADQAKYLTDEQLANKLVNTSFFNKSWTQDEIIKYTQEAYNALRSQGKTGLQSIEISGEIINVFIKDDGAFDTAYGIYKYVVDDFR